MVGKQFGQNFDRDQEEKYSDYVRKVSAPVLCSFPPGQQLRASFCVLKLLCCRATTLPLARTFQSRTRTLLAPVLRPTSPLNRLQSRNIIE